MLLLREIVFEGKNLKGVPTHRRLGLGLAHVLERRRLFPYMTVHENLMLGAYLPALRAEPGARRDAVPDPARAPQAVRPQPLRRRAAAGRDRAR